MTDDGIATLGIRDLLDQNPIVGTPRMGRRRAWTTVEVKILKANYPVGGVPACLSALPGRTASSIYQQARIAGLRAPKGVGGTDRQSWTTSPQIDAMIGRVYQATPKKGDVVALARTLGRPKWWVVKRAVTLGYAQVRFRESPWSEAEIDLIAANSAKSPHAVSRMLKRRGFTRTPTAVSVKLKRLGQPTGKNADLDHCTGTQLAKMFGVDAKTIIGWIAKGWLKAGRRGTARVAQQGGDEHWIHRRDIRQFVVDNAAAVDLRKVDKFWFIELMAEP